MTILWTQFHSAFFPALSVVVVLLWFRISTTVYFITSKLDKCYPSLWGEMGRPKVPRYFAGIDMLVLFSIIRPGLTQWVVSGEFKNLRDSDLTRLVQHLKGLILILVSTFVVVVLRAGLSAA